MNINNIHSDTHILMWTAGYQGFGHPLIVRIMKKPLRDWSLRQILDKPEVVLTTVAHRPWDPAAKNDAWKLLVFYMPSSHHQIH